MKHARLKQSNIHTIVYDSPQEVQRHIEAKQDTRAYSMSSKEPANEWSGNVTYEQALSMIDTGWTDGLQRVTQSEAVFQIPGRSVDYAFDVVGDMLDVGTFLSGQPECWLTEVDGYEQSMRSRIKRVCVSGSYSAGVDAEHVINRGMAIMAAIDTIEASGARTELYISYPIISNAGSEHNSMYLVKIKDAEQQMNRASVLYWLSHPAAFRKVAFRLMEIANVEHGINAGYGYGKPAQEGEHAKWLKQWCDEDDVTFDAVLNTQTIGGWMGYETPESAAQQIGRIVETISKQMTPA